MKKTKRFSALLLAGVLTAGGVAAAPPAAALEVVPPPDQRLAVGVRCGDAIAQAILGVPTVVGTCAIEIAPTEMPTTSPGRLTLHVTITPLMDSNGIIVAVGYEEFNAGLLLDARIGSTAVMTLSIEDVDVLGVGTGDPCLGWLLADFQVAAGDTRARGVIGSRGSHLASVQDGIRVLATYEEPAGGGSIEAEMDGLCGGDKEIHVWTSGGALAGMSGRYHDYSFVLTGPPTYLGFVMNDTAPRTKQFVIDHNSNRLSGWVRLASYGTVDFTNAPKHYEVVLTFDGDGELSTLDARANKPPAGGASFRYRATIAAINVDLDVRKLESAHVGVDMRYRLYDAWIDFTDGQGFIDGNVWGVVNNLGYEVRLDGEQLTAVSVGLRRSSYPIVSLGAKIGQCSPSCGFLKGVIRLDFFEYHALGATGVFQIVRLDEYVYDLQVPLAIDTYAVEGECFVWYSGAIHMCALT